jgi:hypothetical protein
MKTHVLYRRILSAVLSLPFAAAIGGGSTNGFDLSDSVVPADQIFWGGVERDGIRSIDKPKFVSVDDASFMSDKDRVLGVSRNGISKAYPIKILDRHEIVNDRFEDEAVVITYCPLCYSGMVFSAQGVGFSLTFGVSGLLYNSDVLLYDRETGSLWSQLMSSSISGPLKNSTIRAIPASHTTWREWRSRYPDTMVLSTDTGFRFKYTRSPYRDYQRGGRLMYPVQNRSKRYRKKERVLGISSGDSSKAYPFKELRKNGKTSFEDSFAGEIYTIEWSDDNDHARATNRSGKEVATVIVYWFAWYAFHPETEVFRPLPAK